MLYEGALLNAVMALVPDADTSEALSLTAEQLKWLNDNEGRIWNALIGNDLLYSTSPVDATRLALPLPLPPSASYNYFIPSFKCDSRILVWDFLLGWLLWVCGAYYWDYECCG